MQVKRCAILVLYFNKCIFLARNPPPICIGEDIADAIEVEICLHVYDIDINDKFHGCFEILGRIMKFKFFKLKLGCINSPNSTNSPSSLFFEKKNIPY